MKEYIVYYGKGNARYNIGVYAKNEQEAKEIIEKQLKNGLEIIKVKLMEEQIMKKYTEKQIESFKEMINNGIISQIDGDCEL